MCRVVKIWYICTWKQHAVRWGKDELCPQIVSTEKFIYLHWHEKNRFFMDLKGEQEKWQGTADLRRESRDVSACACQAKLCFGVCRYSLCLGAVCWLTAAFPPGQTPEQLLWASSRFGSFCLEIHQNNHKVLQVEPPSCSASLTRARNHNIPPHRHWQTPILGRITPSSDIKFCSSSWPANRKSKKKCLFIPPPNKNV